MTLDPGPLAQHAAYVIDKVTAEYGDKIELVDAVIAVELHDPDDETSTVEVFSMSKRNVAAIGLLVRSLYAAAAPDG